jgi:hypothetical protein
MAVSSPSFAAAEGKGTGATAIAVSGRVLSLSVPLRFMLTGLVSLLAATLFCAVRPEILATYHYNQHVLAVTHLITLGWICSVIMGAMYQLVPVALETQLHHELMARWHFGLHVIGSFGMVWMFWKWNPIGVAGFGLLVGIGILLFVYNLTRTLRRAPHWNVVATGIASALAWLSLTMVAGLWAAAAKSWTFSPFDPIAQMHAHAHLGGVGFFLLTLVGVSYKLVPMFVLSEIQNVRRARWSLRLINTGLIGLILTMLVRSSGEAAMASIVIVGVILYALEMCAILRARKRRFLDWGLRYFLTGLALLLPLCALAVVLCWPSLPVTVFTTQLENVYGFVALMGLITLALMGMLYKILPFLVWYARYSREIGRRKVPALADLYSARLQIAGYPLFILGLAVVSAATMLGHAGGIRVGALFLMASQAVFFINTVKMLLHLRASPGSASSFPTTS